MLLEICQVLTETCCAKHYGRLCVFSGECKLVQLALYSLDIESVFEYIWLSKVYFKSNFICLFYFLAMMISPRAL